MTILAYRAGVLAADRLLESGGTIYQTTKIWKVKKELIGVTGVLSAAMALAEWYKDGAYRANYPNIGEAEAALIVVDKKGLVWEYESSYVPFQVEGEFSAFGSGQEGGMIAMHLGCTAAQAVAAVSLYNTACGMGIDFIEL